MLSFVYFSQRQFAFRLIWVRDRSVTVGVLGRCLAACCQGAQLFVFRTCVMG